MKISVIICTRNRLDDVKKTLPSILAQTRLPNELIIVDSSDEKKLKVYLDALELPFSVRYFHTQPGLTLQPVDIVLLKTITPMVPTTIDFIIGMQWPIAEILHPKVGMFQQMRSGQPLLIF